LGWSDRRFRAAWNAAKAGANTTVALDTGTGEKPNDINASQCFRQEFPISPANGSIESSRHHLASDASAHASLDAFNAEASKTPGKVKLPPASGARKADASAASTPYRGVEAEARGTVVVCCADNNPTQSVRGEPRVQHGARDVATSSVRADAKVHGDKQTANDPVQASNASEFLVHQEHRPNHYNITALEGRDATSVPGNVLVAGSGRPSTKLSTNDSWVSYQETWNEQRGEEPQSNPNTHEVTPTDCDGDRDEDHDDWSDDELSEGARAERYHNEQRMAFRLMRKARPSNGNGGYLMLAHDRLVHMTRVLA
jgi:hypothetical protein